ncbi:MAG: alkyl hydroperoxide reductase, partial [Planctomycetales bacterium]
RIDNQYEPGLSRPSPTRRDLRDAIEALASGRDVPHPQTQAVGCRITFVKEPQQIVDPASAVTFTRDVAPILNKYCVECHRQGEIGPFALTNHEEVAGWAGMMLEVIDQKRMPPWHADPRYGKFVGARRMPKEARAILAAWIDQGTPRGDVQDQPPQPKWSGAWRLSSPPDAEFAMRNRPFIVPPEGTVEYQYFVVDPKWTEDRWIRAAQVLPGNRSVVHHAIVFVRRPDGSDSSGIGWLGAYVPGQTATALPTGHARRIPAHSKLVFQMHYTPNGQATQDVTKVGVWFSDPDETTHEVTTRVALNQHFEIPPGAGNHAVSLRLDGFASGSRLLGATPHMHLRGKSFRLNVRRGESKETLLFVPNYDFNWQHSYRLETPLPLARVDAVEMEVRFDNSSRNPANPAPDEHVTWGDQTWQEMAVAFLDIAHPRGEPRLRIQRTDADDPRETAKRRRRIREETDRFLSRMDRNGDGVVVREETPDAFRKFGFRGMDHNGDGRLDRKEIEAAAAWRF